MKVVVASKNPVKIEASRAAFAALLPDADLQMSSISVESGVSDQPTSDEETRRGAKNRAASSACAQKYFRG